MKHKKHEDAKLKRNTQAIENPTEARLKRNARMKEYIWDLYEYMNHKQDEFAEIELLEAKIKEDHRATRTVIRVDSFCSRTSIACILFGLFLLFVPPAIKDSPALSAFFAPLLNFFSPIKYANFLFLGFGTVYLIISKIATWIMMRPRSKVLGDDMRRLQALKDECHVYYNEYKGFKPFCFQSSIPCALYAFYAEMDDHPEFDINDAASSLEEKGIIKLC